NARGIHSRDTASTSAAAQNPKFLADLCRRYATASTETFFPNRLAALYSVGSFGPRPCWRIFHGLRPWLRLFRRSAAKTSYTQMSKRQGHHANRRNCEFAGKIGGECGF